MRTPEQVAADDALTDAINACYLAYWPDAEPEPRILTAYMVLAHRTSWDEDGDRNHEYGFLNSNNDLSQHEMLGLLAYTQTRLHHAINGFASDED